MAPGTLPPAFLEALRRALASPDALLLGSEASDWDRDAGRHAPVAPQVVVLPSSAEEVAAVVKACAAHRVALTPRGAGTGLEGGAIPIQGGVVLDTSKMDSIRVLPDERLAVVGPGVRKLALKNALAAHGLLFGPDPSSNPSLGGMASTSGSGMTTLRYGTTRENVVSMLVVTPAGDIIRTRTAVRKSSSGLELNQLYIGAEGTLGVIVELTLRLFPEAPARAGAVLPFPSVEAAAKAVLALLKASPQTLLRCELLNAEAVVCTNAVYGTTLEALPTLFVECASADRDAVRRDAEAALAIVAPLGAPGFKTGVKLAEDNALDDLWEARRGCYPASMRYRQVQETAKAGASSAPAAKRAFDKVLTTDVCVPLPALPAVIAATEADFERAGLMCIICAHIADGNFHCLVPYQTAEEAAACHAAEERLVARAVDAGGTVSGEHGVGMGKIEHCLREHGHAHLGVQLAIKRALDPFNLMNPGKLYHEADKPAHSKL